MPSWHELTQQLPQSIHSVIHFLKARRREEASIGLAAFLFWVGHAFSGWLPPELVEFLKPWHVTLIAQSVCYVVGLVLLVYSGYRLWHLVSVPPLPPEQTRPSAIKGPMAFTDDDGELFRKLGRGHDLQKLLGFILDNQVPMVILMGASGVGKTSLLRAGLTHVLANRDVQYHYWEAVPTVSGERLLRAIQETWQEKASSTGDGVAQHTTAHVPTTLDDLVNPSSELCRHTNHVIVLDQFEQLRGRNPVFRLLRRVAREAKPPHRITWVVAFRREFRADWSDFIIPEQERGFFPPEISLQLFTVAQAQDIVGQLIHDAHLSIEQSVVDNMIAAATVDGEVSSVDIGIGMIVLAELSGRQGGKTVTIRDYQFAGGAEGLLTQYISRCLDHFPEAERETMLKAMLALRDPETSQRLAEGLSIEQMAREVGMETKQLKPLLDRLAQRDMRLLEYITAPGDPAARYRLPHERLIPALHRLAGKLLVAVDQAKLQFERAFLAWKQNDKRAQYLLKSNDLRLIERYTEHIPWGGDAQEKRTFLRSSKRRRNIISSIAGAALCALIGMSWLASMEYQRFEHRRFLRESGYPPALYEWQHQLKTLVLEGQFDLERFTWLSSQLIEELEIKALDSTNSLAGLSTLARHSVFKKLTLDLSGTQVSILEPLTKLSGLTQLSLDLSRTQVNTLEPLTKLMRLQTLSISSATKAQRMTLQKIADSLIHLKF